MRTFLKEKNITLISCGTLAFLVGFFGPIEFYFSNVYNVWYDLYNILPMAFITFVIFWLMLSGIGMALGQENRMGGIYIYVVSVLTICLYIQGTFVKIPYGEMNGESIDFDQYVGEDLKSTILWIVLISISVLIYRKYKERIMSLARTVMICMVIMQMISLVIVGISSEGFKPKKSMRPVDELAYTYSSKENFIILVLDTFDSRVFEDYILNGNEEKVAMQYEDFTYYRDTMGMFTLTNYAFPHIITGEKYLGDMYYEEYINSSYKKSPLLNMLNSDGWDVRIHTDQPLPSDCREYIDNAKEITYTTNDYIGMWLGLYKLVEFKYFPTALKRYVYYPYEYLDAYRQVKSIDGDRAIKYSFTEDSWENKDFYESIDNIAVQDEKKSCQIYHIKGLHALRNLSKDMTYIYDSDKLYSLEEEAEVVSDIVASWIDGLKAANLYDNSTIVIMADHGSVEYKTEDDNFAQCPLFMIKGKNERHKFNVSQVPVSYDDLQGIFVNLLAGIKRESAIEKVINEGNDLHVDKLWSEYGIDELKSARDKSCNNNDTVRRRYIIFHRYAGNLGGKAKGGTGYELYSDYEAYYGKKIQVSEKKYP